MNPDPRIANLPSTIYLLPTEGFILLPEMTLPLTIVDSRSRELLDATEAAGGYVGLVQGRRGETTGSRFFSVGCLARIGSLERGDQGYRVTFDGLIRFRVREELAGGPGELPRAAVAYEEFAHDLDGGDEEDLPGWNPEAFKERLLEFGRERFGTAGILETMTPRQVVRFMAQTSPFSPAERQALLEAPGFRELLETLVRLLALNFLTSTPDASPPERAN